MKVFTLIACLYAISLGCHASTLIKFRNKTGRQTHFARPWPSGNKLNQPQKLEQKTVGANKASRLLFVENNGQVVDTKNKLHPEVLFTAKSASVNVYLTGNSINYVFTKVDQSDGSYQLTNSRRHGFDHVKGLSTYRFSLKLEGGNKTPQLIKAEEEPYYETHYLAHCPNGIVAKSYTRFILKDVYPGVDWVIYSNGNNLKYDFVLTKASDAAKIRLKVNNADVHLNLAGDLVMKIPLGQVKEDKPVSFQHGRKLVSSFTQIGNQTYGFRVNGADAGAPLTIDPNVIWATYFGGASYDAGNSCVTDAAGNVFMAGATASANLPVSAGAFQSSNAGSFDVFLLKLSNSGARLWATYYGGSADEDGLCTIDGTGNLYIAGLTNSADLPVASAYQSFKSDTTDAFLLKFNSNGTRIWATYYGGNGRDQGRVCTADGSGNIYFSGITNSTNLPSTNSYQPVNAGLNDAFLVKFSPTGTPMWSTYYGGSNNEIGWACTTDLGNNVYLVGMTASSNLPVSTGAFQLTNAGGRDAFVVKFDSSGSRLWATYFGGTGDDDGISCVIDSANSIYLAGPSSSIDLPISGAYQPVYAGGNGDAFIAKFDINGRRQWATYYGGTEEEDCSSAAIDAEGNVYITGETRSANFPLSANAIQSIYGGGSYDSYLVKFDPFGNRLWSSFYGGDGLDIGNYCAADPFGNIYLTGTTTSSNFPISGAFQGTIGGSFDAFVVRLNICNSLIKPTISANGDTSICQGDSVILSAPSGYVYLWSNLATTQQIIVKDAGIFSVRLISSICTSEISNAIQVIIKPAPATPTITASGPLLFCLGDSVRLSAPAGLTYRWSTNETTQSIVVRLPGIYNLKTSAGGCESPAAAISVNLLSDDSLTLGHNQQTFCPYTQASYQYSARSKRPQLLRWQIVGGTIISQDTNNVLVNWTPNAPQYVIKVNAAAQSFCIVKSDSLIIRLDSTINKPGSTCQKENEQLSIPNVITPNQDGSNDTFTINNLSAYPDNQLTIFNRYGLELNTYKPYQNQFNAATLPAGTYYIIFKSGEGYTYKGWLSVLK